MKNNSFQSKIKNSYLASLTNGEHYTYIIALFFHVDEFCIVFTTEWKQVLLELHSPKHHWWKNRPYRLAFYEIMMIAILSCRSSYRTFKGLLSLLYPRLSQALIPPCCQLLLLRLSFKKPVFPSVFLQKSPEKESEGIAYNDSTILSVCHICRASSHRVFKKIASKGKTTTWLFFGMKLHLVINHQGEIISWMTTPGNTSDLAPADTFCEKLKGKLFSDKGYIPGKLFEKFTD